VLSNSHWKILSSETCFSARPYVEVNREKVVTTQGRIVDDFYRVRLPRFALCVARTEDGRFIVIRQYKHGPRKVSLSFPAGFVDEGETALEACQRELLEETGFTSAQITPLGEFVDNGNQEGSVGTYFFADGCKFAQAADAGDLETMEMLSLTQAELDTAVDEGQFAVVHHVAAWLLARRRL
jgi:ADP-ribose pyrophosphatase